MRATEVLYYMLRPSQLRAIVQWKVWHNPVHERNVKNETETQKACFKFLDLTSRSFSAVIQELHPELLLPVCVFYLVLRGLDTIEDDTSIPLKTKEPMLREFKDYLEQDGWTFDGNRPEEKDRELLVQFHNVIAEFKNMKPAYREIVKDITDKMGNGMADYCRKAEFEDASVKTIEEYDLYCYYVAGLVGEGLTRLFVEAEFGNPALLTRPRLHKSMGLFLQKTNIIRDVREDHDDDRHFWPKEIWSKYVTEFEDLFKPENRETALNCGSEMVLNALEHVEECLFYLAGLREQSVFNFCAIPQAMAIATLELCFRNPVMFDRNIKITKGDACQLMMESTQNLHVLCNTFRRYARRIHQKNTPKDPNFLKISIVCGKIEKFMDTIFPQQTAAQAKLKVQGEKSEAEKEKAKLEAETRQDLYFMLALMGVIVLIVSIIMLTTAWLLGARFDLAWQELRTGNFRPPAKKIPGEL
ncbi:isoprenoid synthase domain-containing protein [Aspergillus pseudonomiae]|uniref:Squalene synthase n=2 Tax=Aspergillus subgen. Circumdati TaxID=2720871 RepID=A0A0L1IX58_ASPN3|nr:squalene synthase [Aspergillus nomiae NRRL 13137]XP_031935166.1 isoprenoid synthase domain-containing protein [Aspergillus pseudonomiae]KAB8254476.1 isoprenoid synthase domain-containing protein [Aspergillus pseudonomiae]KAE8397847.1 isoprenoid synthase domain-containing protein [Aspergillus pseudonomiae]KNG83985.1 squalene synthase [Aspergillus nomiae NRRL 13137]